MNQHVSTQEEIGNTYRTVVGKTKGKHLLSRGRPKWEDNIKMNLKEI
jgi:hypothetical protein